MSDGGRTIRSRHAFTLVEMLVVITIIGILASLTLGALYVSGESAKRQRTISVVNKLHALLMQRYGSYLSRRVPIDPLIDDNADGIPDIPRYDSDGDRMPDSDVDALFGATNGQVTIFTNAVDHYTAFGAVPYRVVNAGDAQIVKD
ncbi:MAG: type II secretion system GspH family protein, partial [Pirellulales bacterium]|nr:type II secretion system GspH family protein [Pirellulales bacterium]